MSIAKNKNRFFILCFITYATAYLCRLNLSVALEKMGSGLGLGSSESLTLLGTSFFIVYALSQLICGFAGDKVNAVKFVTISVCGLTASNFLISQMTSFIPVLLLWCCNAVFQAMLWGPMMRMLSMVFPPEAKTKLTLGMTISQICGYILTWGGLGQLLLDSAWKNYFLIPSLIAVISAAAWLYISFSVKDIEPNTDVAKIKKLSTRQAISIMIKDKLYLTCIMSILSGIIKESFSMWAPIILTMLLGINVKTSLLFLMMFPFGQTVGSLLSAFLHKKFTKSIYTPLIISYSIMAVICLMFFIPNISVVATVLLMVLVCALCNCSGCTFFGIIPLSYSKDGMVSTLAGMFDFCSYVGSAISSFVLAILLSSDNIIPLVILWGCMAIASIILAVIMKSQSGDCAASVDSVTSV